MKKRSNQAYTEIDILKELHHLRIKEQEMKIKSSLKGIADNVTGASMVKQLQDNLFSGSGLAFKLGFMAVSLISNRIRSKKRKK